MQTIKVENLSKTFRIKRKEKGMRGSVKAIFHPQTEEIRAVKGVSFAVEEGEMLAFIGPNGAGKSTTIKMLTGILYPDDGCVEVLGIDPAKKRKQLAYQIGTVFGQKEQLWTHLTPYDNFRFFGAIYDLSKQETEERIAELAERFALQEFIDTPVRNLSLGQRIRCEIVASLLHKPKVLFLDEPTIGLDPVVKENVRELIRQMNREEHTTIFLTSHDVGDIEKLCQRIIIVNDGQIVLDDSVERLKHHYLDPKSAGHGQEEMISVSMEKMSAVAENGDSSDVSLEDIIVEIYKAQGEE
ncbi:MAG: ATP-binding cassette domain-containing protein [Lachnospiraceae bacterium]|nr:ATP-binding cassette domain-containing protein [Lachnospiraceae bacterium]